MSESIMSIVKAKIQLKCGACSYWDYGKGSDILMLIPGLSLNYGLEPLVLILGEQYRVIVPDLPFFSGYNYSFRHSLEAYKVYLLELMKTFGDKEFFIFGNSLGGSIALKLATVYDVSISKIVIRAPYYSFRQLPFYCRSKGLVHFYKFLSSYKLTDILMQEIFKYIFIQMSLKGLDRYDGQLENILTKVNMKYKDKLFIDSLKELLFSLTELDMVDELVKIESRVLIMYPEYDSILNEKSAEILQCHLKKSWVSMRYGTYHNVITENLNNFTREILNFLQ